MSATTVTKLTLIHVSLNLKEFTKFSDRYFHSSYIALESKSLIQVKYHIYSFYAYLTLMALTLKSTFTLQQKL